MSVRNLESVLNKLEESLRELREALMKVPVSYTHLRAHET
jgi:hypothetical protein